MRDMVRRPWLNELLTAAVIFCSALAPAPGGAHLEPADGAGPPASNAPDVRAKPRPSRKPPPPPRVAAGPPAPVLFLRTLIPVPRGRKSPLDLCPPASPAAEWLRRTPVLRQQCLCASEKPGPCSKACWPDCSGPRSTWENPGAAAPEFHGLPDTRRARARTTPPDGG